MSKNWVFLADVLTEELTSRQRWTAIDLDGTLAEDAGIPGNSPFSPIGRPIRPIVNLVQELIAQGRRLKIFTARAHEPGCIPLIQDWLEQHGMPRLEVTNVKDPWMDEMYDDRARQVVKNTGHIVTEGPSIPTSPSPSIGLVASL
jgi:hypothetical protein